MTVVSDTSPINYLILIELQDLLPKLLDRVLIPYAVHRELQSSGAPDPIKRFLEVGIFAENLVPCAAGGDEADHGADRDTHAPDARLSAHYSGVTCNAGQLRHFDAPSDHPIVDELAR